VSYILDALKRSERSRQLHRPLAYRSEPPSAPAVPMALAIPMVSALVIAAVVAVFWWRASVPDSDSGPSGPAEAVQSTATSGTHAGSSLQSVAGRVATAHVSKRSAGAAEATTQSQPGSGRGAAGPIPLLSAMPTAFQDRLPPMEVNIHVYSPDPAQCILYINNRSYGPGDEVTGGAVLEEVVPDGVVLRYDGQQFRLPRPR